MGKKPRRETASPATEGAMEKPKTTTIYQSDVPLPEPYAIRPSRDAAERCDDDFVRLLEAVEAKRSIPNSVIADLIGDNRGPPHSNISIKRSKGFTLEERMSILKYIFEKVLPGNDLREKYDESDVLYYAFLNFFGAKTTSQDTARAEILGTYKLWRFSVEHSEEFVAGRLDFFEDPDTRAVKVEMYQPKSAAQGLRGTEERAVGYFFRVSHMYLMILRDEINRDFRATVWSRFKYDYVGSEVNPNSIFQGKQRHLVHLDGFALGIDGNSGFFSPVHLSLVDDAKELAELNAGLGVLKDGVPPRVVEKLMRNGPLKRL